MLFCNSNELACDSGHQILDAGLLRQLLKFDTENFRPDRVLRSAHFFVKYFEPGEVLCIQAFYVALESVLVQIVNHELGLPVKILHLILRDDSPFLLGDDLSYFSIEQFSRLP